MDIHLIYTNGFSTLGMTPAVTIYPASGYYYCAVVEPHKAVTGIAVWTHENGKTTYHFIKGKLPQLKVGDYVRDEDMVKQIMGLISKPCSGKKLVDLVHSKLPSLSREMVEDLLSIEIDIEEEEDEIEA